MTLLTNTWGKVAYCDICDNYTPQTYVFEENTDACEYCWNAYGEIH
jgi:hypothetical protein